MQIFSYRKSDGSLVEPEYKSGEEKVVSLCEIDGESFIAVPDELVENIQKFHRFQVKLSVLSEDTRENFRQIIARIKSASPAVKLIREAVVGKIRERYSVEDEICMLRIAPSVETAAWNDHVEACRQWGRDQKSALGL